MRELRGQRSVRTLDNGQTRIVQEPGNRVIIQQGGRSIIRNDDRTRFGRFGTTQSLQSRDGSSTSIMRRPDGSQIISVYDSQGRLIERRRRGGGRDFTFFSNLNTRNLAIGALIAAPLVLAPLALGMPRDRYIVDYEEAPAPLIYDALAAAPVQRLERGYSVEEVLRNNDLRDRMRRVDLDDVNFASGSWEVPAVYRAKLSRIAQAMLRIIQRNPREVFLIEGHTDAVGNPEDNLTLSDRRAEAIAIILTQDFQVPPENLLQQGYGETLLKIPSQASEPRNRRVTIRRVTPLLAKGN
jgi:outer membrane protein OmpA-like peptidoglycan-associated protein